MNQQDHGTYFTEKLLHLNSYALTVGFSEDEVPFGDVSGPTENTIEEHMGFLYRLPRNIEDVSNPTDSSSNNRQYVTTLPDETEEDGGDDSDNNGVSDGDAVQNLQEGYGEDMDVELELDGNELRDPTQAETEATERQLENLDVAEIARRRDEANKRLIEDEMRKLLPQEGSRESTLDAFKRLTDKSPWIPFRPRDSAVPPSDIDREEGRLFDEWRPNYSRDPRAQPHKQFRQFAADWNVEVSRRFKAWSSGENIVQIRLKSEIQLQQYDDHNRGLASLQAVAPREDAHRDMVDATFRANRAMMPPTGAAFNVTPPTYVAYPGGRTPFGVPLTLNSTIAQGAVTQYNPANIQAQQMHRQPYTMALPNLPTVPQPRPVRKVFKSKKYCIVCGYRKNVHVVALEGKGGIDKDGNINCTRQYCGRCGDMKEHHPEGEMGPKCTRNIRANGICDTNVANWYDYKLCKY